MRKIENKILQMFAAAFLRLTVLSGSLLLWFDSIIKNLPEGFTVTAHTGCEETEENSLEAIEKGIEAGAETVEFDLRFDGEGKGILSHDEGKKNPVTLEEALKVIAENQVITVNVDCKTTDNLTEVYRLGEKYGITDRLFYTGIEEKNVVAAKTQTPQIPYFLNYKPDKSKKNDEEYISSLVSLVKETGALGLNVNHGHCSKKMVEMFRAEGLKVSVWTANDLSGMLKCLSFSPDNITTRYPSTLIKLINKSK